MAKLEDVVVSDRDWMWTSQPGGVKVTVFVSKFRITKVNGDSTYATYTYTLSPEQQWNRPIANIAAHAEPEPLPALPKCEPGCTPANPCRTAGVCRGDHEPTVGQMRAANTLYAVAEKIRRLEAPEPIELRCGRDLACGLFRTT